MNWKNKNKRNPNEAPKEKKEHKKPIKNKTIQKSMIIVLQIDNPFLKFKILFLVYSEISKKNSSNPINKLQKLDGESKKSFSIRINEALKTLKKDATFKDIEDIPKEVCGIPSIKYF